MKRVLAIILAAVMVLCLAACGSAAPAPAETAPAAESEPAPAEALSYPTRDITLIVPWAAGGGSDLVARAIASAAQDIMGVNITVQNQTGGGGAVGFAVGAAAAADGYTLTLLTTEITMVPHTSAVAFDYSSFTPICQLNSGAAVIAVPADAPYSTIEEFVAYAKDHPSEIQIGNAGTGALWHLSAVAFEQAAGVTFTHVPYNGASEAVAAVLGGHVSAAVASAAEFASNVEAGNLKLLVVMADERMEAYPDVPTAKESGYDVSVSTWRGIAVPAATPDDVTAYLCDVFAQAAESDSFVEYMNNAGQVRDYLDSAAFGAKMESENTLYGDLLTQLGLSIH